MKMKGLLTAATVVSALGAQASAFPDSLAASSSCSMNHRHSHRIPGWCPRRGISNLNKLLVFLVAITLAGFSRAGFSIDLDLGAEPIKDMRKANCVAGLGFNAAMESVWAAANDNWWFVTNRVETARVMKAAGVSLMRLQCANGWFWNARPNPYDPDSRDPQERSRARNYRRSNPKAAFDFYKANRMKVFLCLEINLKDPWGSVTNNLDIIRWLADNDYKECVAGFECGNETYGNPRYPEMAPYWKAVIEEGFRIWGDDIRFGINVGENFDLNPDIVHMRERLLTDNTITRTTYFSAAQFNRYSAHFIEAMRTNGALAKVSHVIWHAYGCEEPYSCSYHGYKRFRAFCEAFPELQGKQWWLTEVRQRSDEDNHCQRLYRDSLIMAHYALTSLCQPEVDCILHHQLTALSGAVYQSDGRHWYIQWYDGGQNSYEDYRAPYDQPHMEVGHAGCMYRILTEGIRGNPIFLKHGTSREEGAENAFYTSARFATQVYARRKALKERARPFLGLFGGVPKVDGEVEWVAATNPQKNRICLLMVNSKQKEETVTVRVKDRQFAAPTYRTMTCPERFLDCRQVPGEARYWQEVAWEETQSGYATWANWESDGKSYWPLPSGVEPECDDLIISIKPNTVQTVTVYLRPVPKPAARKEPGKEPKKEPRK